MRNAVILYMAREGSSAIISQLGNHPEVVVPVFEELDAYAVEARCGGLDGKPIAKVLQWTLMTGAYEPAWFDADATPPVPILAPFEKRVLFKWRPWGPEDEVARALRASDTGALLLLRHDIVNMQLSMYHSQEILPAVLGEQYRGHPQFKLLEMEPGEREDFLAAVQNMQFAVDPDVFHAQLEESISLRKPLLSWAESFKRHDVGAATICYEDFVQDAARFLEAILGRLGLDDCEEVRETYFKKVNRQDMRSQITNLRELLASARVQELVREWEGVCADVQRMAPRLPEAASIQDPGATLPANS